MANPQLRQQLDGLLTRANAEPEKRDEWNAQFQAIKDQDPDEYQAWKQERFAAPTAPASKPKPGLMSEVAATEARLRAGLTSSASLLPRLLERGAAKIGVPEKYLPFTRQNQAVEQEAQAKEQAADVGHTRRMITGGIGSAMAPIPLPGSTGKVLADAGRGAATAAGFYTGEQLAQDQPLDKGDLTLNTIGGGVLGGGVSLLGKMLRKGTEFPKSNAEVPPDAQSTGSAQDIKAPETTTPERGPRLRQVFDEAKPAPPVGPTTGNQLKTQQELIHERLGMGIKDRLKTAEELAAERLGLEPPPLPTPKRIPKKGEALTAAPPSRAVTEGSATPQEPSALPPGREITAKPVQPMGQSAIPSPGLKLPVAGGTPSLDAAANESLTVPVLNPELHKQVVNASKELFASGKVPYDPSRRPSDQIIDAFKEGKISGPDLESTLTKHGLTRQDFADELLAPLRSLAGRELQRYSVVARMFGAKTPAVDELGRTLKHMGLDLDDGLMLNHWWKRLDNVRRGALVTQLSTAMRNFETQVGRVGLDVLQAPLDAGIQKLTGRNPTVNPLDGFEQLATIFKGGTKQQTDAILKAFPAQNERLFATYSSDLLTKAKSAGLPVPTWAQQLDKGLSKAEGLVSTLNYFNKTQEFFVRRGVFQAELSQRLRAQGKDLTKLIADNQFGGIDPKDVSAAVDKALKATFAEQPAYGSVAADFVRLMNRIPGATFVIPFPRFMVNSMKFLWEYNPTGLLKYLAPAERAALAKGDVSTISKAAIGTALLATSWQLRNSEYAGEKWYELRGADGTTIDIRPFNPFASYLFLADTVKRLREGRLNKLDWRDMMTGVLSTNLRAGTGLYLVDQALNGLVRSDTWEKFGRHAQEFAGEAIGGFLTPLAQINDVLAEFDDNYKIMRDRRAEPFMGPLKARIPGLATDLPASVSPTRSGPMKQEAPLLKQATGIRYQEKKNSAEAEFDRLGFTRHDVFMPTGEYEFDRRRAEVMGPMIENFISPLVEAPYYQDMSDNEKGLLLSQRLKDIHHMVNQMAESMSPLEERQARKEKKGNRWQRGVRKERMAQ